MASKAFLVYAREMRVMARDRRLVWGVTITSLVVLPALMGVLGSLNRSDRDPLAPIPVRSARADSLVHRIVSNHPGFFVDAPSNLTGRPAIAVAVTDGGYVITADRTAPRLWTAAADLRALLENAKTDIVRARLSALGLDQREFDPFTVRVVDTSSAQARGAQVLGFLIPYLVIVLLVANAIRALYIAVGEKEKNTLASLLVCQVPRRAIVLGKALAIMSFALAASMLLIAGMTLFANFGFSAAGDSLGDVAFSLSLTQIAQLVANIGSLALLVSSIIMILGTVARTQREAGIYTAPLLFVSIFLAVFALADRSFSLAVFAVPILGNSLAMRETIVGSIEWSQLALPIVVDVAMFAVLIWGSVLLYRRETVLFRK